MIQPITIAAADRTLEFKLDIDPARSSDAAIMWYLQQGSPCEPEVVNLLLRVVKKGDFVIDAGANVGFFTVILSKLVGPYGRVMAFEPGENNLPSLRKNLNLNSVVNVKVCEQPLAAEVGPIPFHLSEDTGLNSRWTSTEFSRDMMATTLEDECDENPRLIKMDIEGSELEALRGFYGWAEFIVCEMNEKALQAAGASTRELRTYMEMQGYGMFVLHPDGQFPTLISPKTDVTFTRENSNVLFSTIDSVGKAWSQVAV